MVERDHPLSVTAQCRLLAVARSTFYHRPRGESPYNLELMRMIDEQYLSTPFYGVGQMTYCLRQLGHSVNPKRIARLWRVMGLRATVPGPHTSRPHPQHKVYPYLLRDLKIDRANQVWMADITYIPMPRGFFYLVAILDVYSRRVMGWALSNSLDADSCVEAVRAAVAQHGAPEILNTDQGSQFTSNAFISTLTTAGIRPSMDGKGRAIDNVFIERFWRSYKYEDLYLRDYADGHALHGGIHRYVEFYNHKRPHSLHDGLAPDTIYQQSINAECHPPLGATPALETRLHSGVGIAPDSPYGRLPAAGHPPLTPPHCAVPNPKTHHPATP